MSTNPLRIAVAGATGRMGQAVVRAILQSRDYVLAAAFARNAHPDLGKNAGTFAGAQPSSIELTEVLAAGMAEADALIDFTAPAASLAFGRLAADAHVVHVLGSTGFSPEQEAQVTALAGESVIIKSSNMSLGVTLLASLVRQAAKALSEFDVEIFEMHHRSKVDAPSGTALLLGEAVAEGRSRPLAEDSACRRGPNDLCARRIGGRAMGSGQVKRPVLNGGCTRIGRLRYAWSRWPPRPRRSPCIFKYFGKGAAITRPQKIADSNAFAVPAQHQRAGHVFRFCKMHADPVGIEEELALCPAFRVAHNSQFQRGKPHMFEGSGRHPARLKCPAQQQHVQAHERCNGPRAVEYKDQRNCEIHGRDEHQRRHQGARIHRRIGPE